MATVKNFKVKPGDMFGGKGVAVFRPFKRQQSHPESVVLTPEEQLASEASAAFQRWMAVNQSTQTDPSEKER